MEALKMSRLRFADTQLFFPPHIGRIKSTSRWLRKECGKEQLSLMGAFNLISRMFGFKDFENARCALLEHERPVTVWDHELDERALAERRAYQARVLSDGLLITEDEACSLVEKWCLSALRAESGTTKPGEIAGEPGTAVYLEESKSEISFTSKSLVDNGEQGYRLVASVVEDLRSHGMPASDNNASASVDAVAEHATVTDTSAETKTPVSVPYRKRRAVASAR